MIWVITLVIMLLFTSCGIKLPSTVKNPGKDVNKEDITDASAPSNETKDDITDASPPPGETKDDEFNLPDSYPKDILPLAVDAEIIDVRENPASNGLEVVYVSSNDIDTVLDFYEEALKDAQALNTEETNDGYMLIAMMDDISYVIYLSMDAMNPNPKYAGKLSVYIILSGLEGISGESLIPDGEGEKWPSAELPGVPELDGYITQILREDGIIRLELTVNDNSKVKSYIGELEEAGFTFDTEPDPDDDHMEFLAFKDESMISFGFKGEENLVSIEYQK